MTQNDATLIGMMAGGRREEIPLRPDMEAGAFRLVDGGSRGAVPLGGDGSDLALVLDRNGIGSVCFFGRIAVSNPGGAGDAHQIVSAASELLRSYHEEDLDLLAALDPIDAGRRAADAFLTQALGVHPLVRFAKGGAADLEAQVRLAATLLHRALDADQISTLVEYGMPGRPATPHLGAYPIGIELASGPEGMAAAQACARCLRAMAKRADPRGGRTIVHPHWSEHRTPTLRVAVSDPPSAHELLDALAGAEALAASLRSGTRLAADLRILASAAAKAGAP